MMRDTLLREMRAARQAFFPTERNSKAKKYFLWVAITVWGVASLGILFGFVSLQSQAAVTLWGFLTAIASLMFVRVQGEESERLKREEGDDTD